MATIPANRPRGRGQRRRPLPPNLSVQKQREEVIYRYKVATEIARARVGVATDATFEAALQVVAAQVDLAAEKEFNATDLVLAVFQVAVVLAPEATAGALLLGELSSVLRPSGRPGRAPLATTVITDLYSQGKNVIREIEVAEREIGSQARDPSSDRARRLAGATLAVPFIVSAANDVRATVNAALTQSELTVERDVRAGTFDAQLEFLAQAYEVGELETSTAQLLAFKEISCALQELTIWAVMYGFDSQKVPSIAPAPSNVLQYWFKRFGPLIDAMKELGVNLDRGRVRFAVLRDDPSRAVAIQEAMKTVGSAAGREISANRAAESP